jgi:hypothetical protein
MIRQQDLISIAGKISSEFDSYSAIIREAHLKSLIAARWSRQEKRQLEHKLKSMNR